MGKMKNKLDNLPAGFALASLAACLAFVLYGLWWTKDYYQGLAYFYHQIFLEMNVMKIGTISVLAQMLVFYTFYQKRMQKGAYGAAMSIILLTIFLILKSI